MTTAVPWNVKGVDFDAREAAKIAARRAGMSLGEWLNSIIADQAAELGVTTDDIDDDERLEAVAARLASLSRRPEQNAPRGTRRFERDGREPARRMPSHEAEQRRARAVYDEADRRDRAPADPELLLDRAVAAFDRRSQLANDRTAAALAKVSHRLGEIEGRLDLGAAQQSQMPAKDTLSRLEARLEGIAGRLEAKPPAGGREDIARIEAKLNRLSETIDRSARAQPPARQQPLASLQRGPLGRRSVSDAIAEITQRQAALDHGGRPASGPDHLGNLQADLAALSTRLDDMRHDFTARDEQQFRAIGQKIEALGQTRLENGGRTAPGADHLGKLQVDLTTLSTRLEEMRRDFVARNEQQFRAIGQKIEVLSQVRLEHGGHSASTVDHLGNLPADLAALSTRLEEMRRDFVARDELQFRAIGQKIEALGQARPDAAALARIHTQTEEIRNLLATAVAQPRPIENIEGQIAALAERMETIAPHGFLQTADEAGNSKLAEIRATIERSLGDPLLHQIEGRIESLARKVDQALSSSTGGEHFDELRQQLEFIHQSLAARIERPAPSFDSSAFEGMMREIVDKLDQPPPPPVDSPKLETLMSRLSDRLEVPSETRRLEKLVADLVDKIEAAIRPQTDPAALNELQDQIARLVQRFDNADAAADTLSSLERHIADLFAELEETRRAAVDAAATAARNAARETLREAALSQAAEASLSADGQTNNVTRELADLRALQDAADRQTHATLTAVHETLEKVVDRLAMLEDDIVDVRGTTPEPPPAAGPSPMFAPLPRVGDAPAMPRADFPDFAPARTSRSEPSLALETTPDPRVDDRHFLIEPGSGFSPERRNGEQERRGTNKPPQPPDLPGSKPPPAPSSGPSAPPPASSTQANFIAAARRTIQANAMESAEAVANSRKTIAGLDSTLAEVRSRARAAAAVAEDHELGLQDKVVRPHKDGGALARASAFFLNRRRPLVLGVAGVVVALCALQLTRNHASPPVVVVDPSGLNAPSRAVAPHGANSTSDAPSASAPAPVPLIEPANAGPARQSDAAPAKSSALVSPDVDLSPVGSITAPRVVPPSAAPDDAGAADLPALRELAASGDVAAEFELGVRYAEGRSLSRNLTLAAQWLEKAAKQNNAPAQYRLATLYEKGLGVTRDTNVALNWYQRAAAGGNIRAMHNLAVLTAQGSIDGKPNYDDAATWFRKAAEFGVGDSQYNLAILYARGLGVPKDLQQSYVWFALAAGQGDADAVTKRDEVATHLDPKQLADAKAVVDSFVPHKASDNANNVAPPPGGWSAPKVVPGPDAKRVPNTRSAPGAKISTTL